MRLEPVTTGHLEINFFFEQCCFLAKKLADGAFQHRAKFLEPIVKRHDIFNPADQVGIVTLQALFMINPVFSRFFRERHQFLGPGFDALHLIGSEGLADDQITIALERLNLFFAKDRRVQHKSSLGLV